MLKPTSTYKMSKPTKTMLALSGFRNDNDRHAWRAAMIGAELASRVVVKSKADRKTAE
jgi:hypothetical protein